LEDTELKPGTATFLGVFVSMSVKLSGLLWQLFDSFDVNVHDSITPQTITLVAFASLIGEVA
jgi:hypothetical protein